MVCKAMGQVLRTAGYDFMAVMEGARVIPTLLANPPDLVFLDLIMPDTNGYEVCSNLRKISRFKAVPIIILSGNDGLVNQVRARLLGATDFLSKPMEPVVILSIIGKYLQPLNQPSRLMAVDGN
ncbi:MAG: response regulator [Leptolyngbyaceae cyanobacterium SM2_3_12]|nr:response regulator [Leptolyngbyaceae cyanobacterium SM2_3_12]